MSEKESDITYFFEGPVSFSSMAAQAFMHFGCIHSKKEKAVWILSVTGEEGEYQAKLLKAGTLIAKADCASRRDAAHFLMDALSRTMDAPLGKWGYLLGMRPTKALYPFLKQGPDWKKEAARFLQEERVEEKTAKLLLRTASCQMPYMDTDGTASFYMHVPFCPSHCVYCSFPSAILHGGKGLDPFTHLLCQDIASAGELIREKHLAVQSLYMGGGTPTILTAAQMDRVLTEVDRSIPLDQALERTVEAGRPDTINEEMLEVLAGHGIDRISVNPQTMQDRILRLISRFHSAGSVYDVFKKIRRYPFKTVNMDFICGLPGQTLGDMEENLQVICQLLPENVTIHTLAVKRGSPFFRREKEFHLPSENIVEEMLSMAGETLEKLGYHPYYLYRQKYMTDDFANIGYALPGHDSVYNIQMIGEHQHVVSAGPGSVSKVVVPPGFHLNKLYMPRDEKTYAAQLASLDEERQQLFHLV